MLILPHIWCKNGISGHLFNLSLHKLELNILLLQITLQITPHHKQITLHFALYGFLMVVRLYDVQILPQITNKSHFLPRGIFKKLLEKDFYFKVTCAFIFKIFL